MKAKTTLLVLIAVAGLATAQEEAQSPAALEIEAVMSEHQKVMMEFQKKSRVLPREEQREFYRNNYPDGAESVAAMEKLITAHPKDPAIVDGVIWIARTTRLNGLKPAHLTPLADHHLDNRKLADLLPLLGYRPSEENARFLETVQTKSKSKANKGAALYATSLILKRDPNKTEEYEEVVKTLAAEHLDLKIGRREVVKAMVAEREATKNLAIGKVAPEIVGKDIDGKEMKLSDYRGKVVVLDFWGDW